MVQSHPFTVDICGSPCRSQRFLNQTPSEKDEKRYNDIASMQTVNTCMQNQQTSEKSAFMIVATSFLQSVFWLLRVFLPIFPRLPVVLLLCLVLRILLWILLFFNSVCLARAGPEGKERLEAASHMNEFWGKWQGLCGFCPSEETFCQPSRAHDVDVCSRTVTMSRSGLFEHSGAPKSLCLSTFSLNENSMDIPYIPYILLSDKPIRATVKMSGDVTYISGPETCQRRVMSRRTWACYNYQHFTALQQNACN